MSPVPVNDECMQYYAKLLALKPAVDSGNVEDQAELVDRYKVIIPEAIKSFPVSQTVKLTPLAVTMQLYVDVNVNIYLFIHRSFENKVLLNLKIKKFLPKN